MVWTHCYNTVIHYSIHCCAYNDVYVYTYTLLPTFCIYATSIAIFMYMKLHLRFCRHFVVSSQTKLGKSKPLWEKLNKITRQEWKTCIQFYSTAIQVYGVLVALEGGSFIEHKLAYGHYCGYIHLYSVFKEGADKIKSSS